MPSYLVVEKSICPHDEIRLTKINTFFIVFRFDDDEHGLKIEKAKTASKFWYIYGSGTFFFVYQFFLFSLRLSCISLRVCTGGEGRLHPPVHPSSIHPSVRPSVCLSICSSIIPASGPAVSGACFLFLFPASCLSVGGALVVSLSSTQGRQGQSFGYVHIHGRSMASNKQQHYFRRSNTHTDPSDALAPTLSPAAFQQTSKIPPVPL